MELLKMPIVEYYKNCLSAAKQQGYKWVISLIARPGDVDGLYEDLREFWSSLDSITGRYFLFVVAGEEDNYYYRNDKYIQRKKYRSYYDHTQREQLYNELSYREIRKQFCEIVSDNQAIAVNSLRDYFEISEANIPCLAIKSLFTDEKYIIPIQGRHLYRYFKDLMSKIEGSLKCLYYMENDEAYNSIERIKQKTIEGIEDTIKTSYIHYDNYYSNQEEAKQVFHITGDMNIINQSPPENLQLIKLLIEMQNNLNTNNNREWMEVKNILEELRTDLSHSKPSKSSIDEKIDMIKNIAEIGTAIATVIQTFIK